MCDTTPNTSGVCASNKVENRGSVFLKSSLDGEYQRIVNLANIPLKEELVLDRDSNDALGELSFILVGTQDQKVQLNSLLMV